jgi:molybdenum cofactor cytidylyltransferase
MPWITPAIYAALKNAPCADVVSPTFGGRRGHPVLLRRVVAEEMLRSDPSTGVMREIISRFSSTLIPWDDDSILRDVDTPQEYV